MNQGVGGFRRRIKGLAVLFLLVSGTALLAAESRPILIGDMYVRTGFDDASRTVVPRGLPGWVRIDAEKVRRDPIRIVELALPGVPHYQPFSLDRHRPMTFMAVTTFTIPGEEDLQNRNLALLIRQISENWEIYVNGRLVKSDMHLAADGTIRISRNLCHVMVPLNPLHCKPGENILAFKIIADPAYLDAGFYRAESLIIDDHDTIESLRSETITLILIFIYLFTGIYHLVLFINRPSERHNLFYGLFSIVFFIYILSRTHAIYEVLDDSHIVKKLEFCSLYAVLPIICAFIDFILLKRVRLFTKIYGLFCSLLILVAVPASMPFNTDILRIWQYTSPIPLGYLLFVTIGAHTIRSVRDFHRSIPDGGMGLSLPSAVGRTMYETVPGNLLIGSLVVIACVVFDILDAIYFSYGLLLTQFGFFFFVIGITFILSNRFIYIHKRIEGLNIDLQNKVNDLNDANIRISLSEQKYKLLVEGTNDAVFTMNEQFKFLTANHSFFKQLAVSPAELNTLGLQDLLHDSAGDEKSIIITRQVVQQKLVELVRDRQPVTLRLDLCSAFGHEPVQMQVRLEYITIEGKNEILGKATNIGEDHLLSHLVSEQQDYVISNYLTTAEELSHRITRNLRKFLPAKEINLVRLAVREIIINAIEHGNLNISFEEKSETLINDTYLAFISERQSDPRYRNRHVHITYRIDGDRLEYQIRDEGSGFDHRSLLEDDADSINERMLYHGRGILLAKNIFDEIRYNDLGNEVILVKRLVAQES